ncbi:unnamed protein product [Vitrella brassicaformis CCMP3155]|uniref:Uncharacterized protein n=2 Tax=Vitrella brassicaformis TaxID=1169539 RepID=A0A0G4EEY9_VITBC|nr:unnamed protein product [Vitrella brassicaformis CCMP3155]|eukprot:CEL94268.1 unnamed protein product [Vitrella brassicaformis CCMP3155]
MATAQLAAGFTEILGADEKEEEKPHEPPAIFITDGHYRTSSAAQSLAFARRHVSVHSENPAEVEEDLEPPMEIDVLSPPSSRSPPSQQRQDVLGNGDGRIKLKLLKSPVLVGRLPERRSVLVRCTMPAGKEKERGIPPGPRPRALKSSKKRKNDREDVPEPPVSPLRRQIAFPQSPFERITGCPLPRRCLPGTTAVPDMYSRGFEGRQGKGQARHGAARPEIYGKPRISRKREMQEAMAQTKQQRGSRSRQETRKVQKIKAGLKMRPMTAELAQLAVSFKLSMPSSHDSQQSGIWAPEKSVALSASSPVLAYKSYFADAVNWTTIGSVFPHSYRVDWRDTLAPTSKPRRRPQSAPPVQCLIRRTHNLTVESTAAKRDMAKGRPWTATPLPLPGIPETPALEDMPTRPARSGSFGKLAPRLDTTVEERGDHMPSSPHLELSRSSLPEAEQPSKDFTTSLGRQGMLAFRRLLASTPSEKKAARRRSSAPSCVDASSSAVASASAVTERSQAGCQVGDRPQSGSDRERKRPRSAKGGEVLTSPTNSLPSRPPSRRQSAPSDPTRPAAPPRRPKAIVEPTLETKERGLDLVRVAIEYESPTYVSSGGYRVSAPNVNTFYPLPCRRSRPWPPVGTIRGNEEWLTSTLMPNVRAPEMVSPQQLKRSYSAVLMHAKRTAGETEPHAAAVHGEQPTRPALQIPVTQSVCAPAEDALSDRVLHVHRPVGEDGALAFSHAESLDVGSRPLTPFGISTAAKGPATMTSKKPHTVCSAVKTAPAAAGPKPLYRRPAAGPSSPTGRFSTSGSLLRLAESGVDMSRRASDSQPTVLDKLQPIAHTIVERHIPQPRVEAAMSSDLPTWSVHTRRATLQVVSRQYPHGVNVLPTSFFYSNFRRANKRGDKRLTS